MSEIFISWGSPDAEIVPPLCKRLKNGGYSVFEYTQDMNVGDDIPRRIMLEIDAASLGIVCLSDKTAKRQWITTEVAWLYKALVDGRLKAILAIEVGPLSRDAVPDLLRNTSVWTYDPGEPQQAEATLDRLQLAVAQHLRSNPPLVIPAALFAMTSAQFVELAPTLAVAKALLCQHLGMQSSPGLALDLKNRYGSSVEAFAPFAAEKPLLATVYSAVQVLNEHRLKKGEPSIYIRWVHHDFASPDSQVRNEARDRWRSSNSVLIIDSLSTEHNDVRARLDDVPDIGGKSAVIWVPPYTQRTAELESKILAATQTPPRLSDFFRDWTRREHPDDSVPWRAFDIGTETGLWNWFYKMCRELVEPQPLSSSLRAMTSRYGMPSINPRDLLGR